VRQALRPPLPREITLFLAISFEIVRFFRQASPDLERNRIESFHID
jgi:hypothetical protein